MKLQMALAVARQQVDPAYKGHKWGLDPQGDHMGFYLASNGQWMSGPRSADRRGTWLSPHEFVEKYGQRR